MHNTIRTIATVDELVIIVFNKVGILLVAGRNKTVHFGLNADLFRFDAGGGSTRRLCGRRRVPFTKTSFTLSILQQEETNLRVGGAEKSEASSTKRSTHFLTHVKQI